MPQQFGSWPPPIVADVLARRCALRPRHRCSSDLSLFVVVAPLALVGDGADLRVAELGSPLPYPDDTFDDVVAALVLHYLEDWGPALAELRRILKPGGRLIASVDHPFAIQLMHRQAGREAEYKYFDTTNWVEEWTFGGQSAMVSLWHRPLHAMIEAFTGAGFRIAGISEPEPDPAARELFPEVIAAKPRFLSFLFFVLQADEAVSGN